jgi:hypothetical protein
MSSFAETFSSPRFQRYLLWFGVAVLAAGAAALLIVIFGGQSENATKADEGKTPPAKSVPLRNSDGAQIKTYQQLDPQTRDAVKTFIATAVARENVGQSWGVVAPSMKAGYTKAQWQNADELPVVPYPGVDPKHVRYSLQSASTKEILVEVGLTGKPGVSSRPVAFQLGLEPGAKKGTWLVDYWAPRGLPPGQ